MNPKFLGRHTCLPYLFEAGANRGVPLIADGAPPSVLVVGDRRRVGQILGQLADAVDLRQHARDHLGEVAAARVDVGVGMSGGVPVLAVETQMGGPATEIVLREVLDRSFHPRGARAVLRVGSCGALAAVDGGSLPSLAIASFATGFSAAIEQARRGVLAPPPEADPGRSPASPPRVPCPPAVVEALAAAAREVAPDDPPLIGGCFSKDSLYAEQDQHFASVLEELGCVATEMELATIGPIANELGIQWGGIMATAGRVPDGPWLEPEAIRRNEELAIAVALAALRQLAASR